MISWVILAPVIAASLAGRDCFRMVRRWRQGEATLRELLEEVGIASLITGIAAGTTAHPVIAAGFIAMRGGAEIVESARRARLRKLEENRKRQIGCSG
jgi:hypothetical protein